LVPVDSGKPNGRQFLLAVSRVPATGKKKGSLFFNPGGPGGSGTATISTLASRFPASVRARFDIVTWDPRGVGATLPALKSCPRPNLVLPANGIVNWPAARSQAAASVKAANEACERNNAKYLAHVGTNNVVRDLHALRAAVGDKKLTYWGISYGTRVGYVYALRYPERVRAIVLDGDVNPKGNYAALTQSSVAPDLALQFMSVYSPPDYNSIMATLNSFTANPVDLGAGLQFTRWDYLRAIYPVLKFEAAWPSVIGVNEHLLTAQLDTPEGAAARERMRVLVNEPNESVGGVFSAVNCLDFADRMSVSTQNGAIARYGALAPIWGAELTTELAVGCTGLTFRPDPIPNTRSAASLARLANLRVVMANATNDAATPLVWAQQMRRSFGSGVLIKYRGTEHGLWMATPSTCVNNRITNYFVALKMPKPVTCPFAPVAGVP
jgi:pimeloyl-ACP methyl ester carboxylesterase